jgi:hypothetical protein
VPSETELTAAWSAVLSLLKPGTKAVFGTGRFGPSTATAAIYALANAPTRDHCEKKRAEVEGALATHFGRPVPLRLVTDADLGGPGPDRPSAPVAPAARAAASADEQDEIGDVHALEDAPTAATGVERLAEAFPGAELVEEQ